MLEKFWYHEIVINEGSTETTHKFRQQKLP